MVLEFGNSKDVERILEHKHGWFFDKRGIYMQTWMPRLNNDLEHVDGFPI